MILKDQMGFMMAEKTVMVQGEYKQMINTYNMHVGRKNGRI